MIIRFPHSTLALLSLRHKHGGAALQILRETAGLGRREHWVTVLSGFRISIPLPGSEVVRTALHAAAASLQDVRVDHRRRDVAMPQQLLHRADVVARLQ